jgi:hypothetical protein
MENARCSADDDPTNHRTGDGASLCPSGNPRATAGDRAYYSTARRSSPGITLNLFRSAIAGMGSHGCQGKQRGRDLNLHCCSST